MTAGLGPVRTLGRIKTSDIHIIESLTGGFSRRTGSHLYEALEPIVRALPRRIDLHLKRVTTLRELVDYLGAIAAATRASNRSPLLHLETHGDDSRGRGLYLASGELVTWQQLKPALTAINEASRLNLVVIVAACNGLDLLKILEPTDRAPARLIIGPSRTLSDGQVETANLAFYTTLLSTFDGILAYNAMNDAIEPPSDVRRPLFHVMSAETMFQLVMRDISRTTVVAKQRSRRVSNATSLPSRSVGTTRASWP